MKSLINIGLRSCYSFKKTFGTIETIQKYSNGVALGIADFNNTFAHVYLEKIAKKNGFKPLFGVRLQVVEDSLIRTRSEHGPVYIFIAKNQEGVIEINKLVKTSSEKFYFKAHIAQSDMLAVSENVFVIGESFETHHRLDYVALTPSTSPLIYQSALDLNIPLVYVNDNYYPEAKDKEVYQLFAGSRKHGDEYRYNFDDKTVPQHILTEREFNRLWHCEEAAKNSFKIADAVESFELKRAPMVRYDGYKSITTWCVKGAKKLAINLKDPVYKERYEREMKLIEEKGYIDYFMIVHEMIEEAKKKMFVGHARGSSCGSLVCYLLGITAIDPIKFGLLFERFIDINRHDLPDIDIDFPDIQRPLVIKNLIKKYGEANVCHIANVNRMKSDSAIAEFATALRIPKYESDAFKDSIVNRSAGDERASLSISDAFDTTDIGKDFAKKYPAMRLCAQVEGHPAHAGKHAAGIIVCNDDVSIYGGIDTRDGVNSIQLDKKSAEYLNLLKIDCLGLRTLTILQECAELAGFDFEDYYYLELDDPATYKIFKKLRLNGVFQFEGQAMQQYCKQMGVEHFNDIVAITAIVRPGPLHSGGAGRYVARRTGESAVEYVTNHKDYIAATKDTFGELIYQEQIMIICKQLANMSWGDVTEIRKLISKSAGAESFGDYKDGFIDGCVENGVEKLKAAIIWENMLAFGSYAMNKSHTVAYGHISYCCAYMKAHYPLEFTAANLKHAKDKNTAIKILRDAVENEGIEYIPIDSDLSEVDWCVKDGVLIGGLKNIHGIAEAKAKQIIKMRNSETKYTPAIVKMLLDPTTDFDTIYPCRDLYGAFYNDPKKHGLSSPVSYIKDIEEHADCEYLFLGKVIEKELRDLNEYNEVVKRNGKILSSNNKLLKITVEDDTGQINCRINRFNFDKMDGFKWADELIEDETYVLIKGKIKEGIRIVHISGIFVLNNLEEGES